ncbi:MAG: hypothetical protein KAU50_11570, partial [Candidatus Marinimicrobia bacterium]|nr:hypothetical protein [Candidatus Neomarinimicrobiota bacterium]
SGKEAHAIELAALINCREPSPEGACGRCPSCIKMKTLQHPNLQLVVPLPRRNPLEKRDDPLKALKPADLDSLVEQLAAKARDPYFKVNLPGAQTILINSVRELQRTARLTTAEKGWRTILIFEAEKLCVPQPTSANALLKLLEEPPSDTLFILVTDRPNLLLDTIRSRCLGLHFPQLAGEQVVDYLTSRTQLDAETARILAEITTGNLREARQLAEDGSDPLAALDGLREDLLGKKPNRWQSLVNQLAQQRRSQPLEFATTMRLLQLWLRDLMVLARSGDTEGLIFTGRSDQLAHYTAAWPQADWGAAALAVDRAVNLLSRNIHPGLTLTNLILDVRGAIKGRVELQAV